MRGLMAGARGTGLPQPLAPPTPPWARAVTPQPAANLGSAWLCPPKKAGTFTHPGFQLLGTSRCLLPSEGHQTQEPPAQFCVKGGSRLGLQVVSLAPAHSPVCSGREMCILQLVLTTDRPPASRAETMGPSIGSFSTRSLTSCVPKSRVGMALPLPHTTPSSAKGGAKWVWP